MEEDSNQQKPFSVGSVTPITDIQLVHLAPSATETTSSSPPVIVVNQFKEPEPLRDIDFQNDTDNIETIEEEVGMFVEHQDGSGLEIRMERDGQVYMAACLICGDRASGYHYSVLSCEGCKGFFKRTVQKNLMYTCKDAGKGSCLVNKATRNNCQYCRYHKCLQYGMRRDAVREDRSPGGKHRIKRPRPEEMGIVDINKKMEDNHLELIEKLMEAGPERIPSNPNIGSSYEDMSLDDVMQFGYTELRYVIEWAKKVPYFRDFTVEDQMSMLKSSFMELNTFRLAYRSVMYEDKIKFAEGLVIPVSTAEKMGWGLELVQATADFTARLKELNMDHAEFCIMSAIILTYPDAIGIVDKPAVTAIQTRFLDLLRRYIFTKYQHDTGRYGKILLRLPTLRTVSAKAAERFLQLTLEGVLQINDLVQEMIN